MALVASVVAMAVAAVSSRRLGSSWRPGGSARPSVLAWSIAMATFALAALVLALGAWRGFSPPLFRVFHLLAGALDVPWLALGVVLARAHDRLATRLTGVAAALATATFVPGAIEGDALALVGAALGTLWALALLDGHRDRVRVASAVLVTTFSALAVLVVLPAPSTTGLPSAGLPSAATVLPAHVRAFALGGTTIGATIAIAGSLLAVGRLLWQIADRGSPPPPRTPGPRRPLAGAIARIRSGWRGLGPAGLRDRVTGHLHVGVGTGVAAASGGTDALLGGTAAHAVALAVAVLVLHRGLECTTHPRTGAVDAVGRPNTQVIE